MSVFSCFSVEIQGGPRRSWFSVFLFFCRDAERPEELKMQKGLEDEGAQGWVVLGQRVVRIHGTGSWARAIGCEDYAEIQGLS